MTEVEVAIIGAGTAGLTARRAAKKHGASVVMIDSGPLGTTCARVGCMPSKLLIAASDAAHHIETARQFGVHAGNVRIDGEAVMARVQSERDRFVGFVLKATDEAREFGELIDGRAEIVGPGHISVDGSTDVRFKHLVVATGSTPFVPPPFREVEDYILTNEDIFELKTLPKSALVIGLGVIGLELGQAFARLGVRTTLLGVGGSVGPIRDPEILGVAKRVFAEELDIHPDYTLGSVVPKDGAVEITFVDSNGKERTESFEKIIMAAGRRPTVMNLGLENLGIDPKNIDLDPMTLQVKDHPVFFAGDVNNLHPLLHEAADDGRAAGRNAATFPSLYAEPRRAGLGIVFTDPQIAIVGGGFSALEDCKAVAGEVDWGDQGRARTAGINRGKLRVYADVETMQIIGAEMIGPRAEHLAHLLAWSVQSNLTVKDALRMPFYHPVIEEGLRTALRDLDHNLRHDDPINCQVADVPVGS